MISLRKMIPHKVVPENYKIHEIYLESLINEKNLKVITFTSVMGSRDKSYYISSVAKAMALNGRKVLVIDCNTDNSSLQNYFKIDVKKLLQERACTDNKYFLEAPEIPSLNFVPAFPVLADDNVLNIGGIEVLINKAKEKYDVIFIDSPPAGISSDGVKLSVLADGTIIFLTLGKTPKADARRLKEMLSALDVRLLGVIMESR